MFDASLREQPQRGYRLDLVAKRLAGQRTDRRVISIYGCFASLMEVAAYVGGLRKEWLKLIWLSKNTWSFSSQIFGKQSCGEEQQIKGGILHTFGNRKL